MTRDDTRGCSTSLQTRKMRLNHGDSRPYYRRRTRKLAKTTAMSNHEEVVEEDVEEGLSLGDAVLDEPQTFERLASHQGYICYRPLQLGDRDQVQELHQEWFPVNYKDEFYDELVLERMVNTGEKLFTCAITFHEEENENTLVDEEEEDYIIACVVGSLLDVSRLDKDTVSLLISDPFIYKQAFYIMTLGTVEEFRGARLATSLVEKCIHIAEMNEKCGVVYLHVIISNSAAIRFYERLGFYRVKEIESKPRCLLHVTLRRIIFSSLLFILLSQITIKSMESFITVTFMQGTFMATADIGMCTTLSKL